MIIKMKRILLILLLLTSLGAQAQVNTYIITQTGQAEFDTSRVFKIDSLTTYVTPSQLSDSLATVTGGFDSTYIYQALADTATALRGLIPTVPTIYYQTIKRNGTPYTQQSTLDFSTQFALNDNIGTSATDVSVSALAQSVVTGLTDSLNARVRYVDTSGMLSNYATKNGSNASGTWGINITGNSATTTTNANLTGPITSVGNATSIASQTGTGSKFVVDNTPTLITPILGVASATSLNTGTTLNGTIFAKSANVLSLASTNHALTAGNESTGLNMAFGLYSTSLGIQARNNGVASNIFYNPLGGSVGVGDGSLTGQRIFLVTNTGAGTGDWSSIEVRNAAASTDALRLYTLGTGFTTSVTNVQDGAAVTTGTGLSGGLSVGTQASASLRFYTNNTLRTTIDANGYTNMTNRLATAFATVASANNLTLTTGNVFSITGTTQITAITNTNWQAGSQIILIFAGVLTVKNNTAGGANTSPLLLAGGVDFATTANDVLKLVYNGTNWIEVSRSIN